MARGVRVDAFVICESVTREESGTTVHKIFEGLAFDSFPGLHRSFTVYARLRFPAGPTSYEFEFQLQAPSGAPQRAEQRLKGTSADDGAAEIAIRLEGIRFPEAGRYIWSLLIDGEKVADYRLTAMTREAAAAAVSKAK